MKYLIWAVVIYFAWRWYLASKANAAGPDAADGREAGNTTRADSAAASSAASSAAASGVEKMVGCAHCGIHLPLSEALIGADRRHYCSEEHRALHAAS